MKINKNKIYIFTSKSKQIGYGHFKRSIILKKSFIQLKHDTKIINVNKKKLKQNIKYFNKALKKNYFIIFDFSNKFFFKKNIFLKLINKNLNLVKNKLLIIDSPKDDSLVNYLRKKLNYILPYFSQKKNLNYSHNFFVFNEKFKIKKIKKIKKVSKILITFGGSDLQNSTIKFIHFLTKNFNKIYITAIIGPYFQKQQILKIKKLKKIYKNITLIYFKKDIAEIIDKFDLILTSTGLTRYELSITSKHILVYATNNKDLMINKSFKNKKIAINFSYKDNKKKIINLFNKLIESPFEFDWIIKNRQKLFDFNGPKRILRLLLQNAK